MCTRILVHLNILDLPRPVEHKVTIDWALLNVHLTIGEAESTNRVREWGKVLSFSSSNLLLRQTSDVLHLS